MLKTYGLWYYHSTLCSGSEGDKNIPHVLKTSLKCLLIFLGSCLFSCWMRPHNWGFQKYLLNTWTSLDYWKTKNFLVLTTAFGLLVPLHFLPSITFFVRVINKSIAFHFDLESGFICAYWVQPFALSKPFNGGHSGVDMQCHNGSQTGKKWPQRKTALRPPLKWIWQLCSEKDVYPCLWTCPFPPFSILMAGVTFYSMSDCLGREQPAHDFESNGDGWETIPPKPVSLP